MQSLEAKVDQLQNRLAFMEDEKTRLVTAAKNKNEQVEQSLFADSERLGISTIAVHVAASHDA